MEAAEFEMLRCSDGARHSDGSVWTVLGQSKRDETGFLWTCAVTAVREKKVQRRCVNVVKGDTQVVST